MSPVSDWTEEGSKNPNGHPDFSLESFTMGRVGSGLKLPLRMTDSYFRFASHCSWGGGGWLS